MFVTILFMSTCKGVFLNVVISGYYNKHCSRFIKRRVAVALAKLVEVIM